jgi:hypothetical protein
VVAVDIVEDYKTGELVPTFDIHGAMRDQSLWPDFIGSLRAMVGGSEFMLMDVRLVADVSDGGRWAADTAHAVEDDRFQVVTAVMAYETAHEGYFDGFFHVPVRDVVQAILASYQLGRIEIASDLELAEALAGAIEDMSLRNMKNIDPLGLTCAFGVYEGMKNCPVSLKDVSEVGYDSLNWGFDNA